MDNTQFQLPPEYTAELPKEIEQRVLQSTPGQPQAPFQFVKDIEVLVESFRETAEGIEQRNGREVKMKALPVTLVRPARKHDEIRRDLIEIERRLGGTLFAEAGKYHFWLGDKSASIAKAEDIADWYIEEVTPGHSGGVVTHIETHPQYIKKFDHKGRLVPMTISDLEVFIPAVYHYVYAIIDAYPFEKDRAEVILEDMSIPNDVSALLPPIQTAEGLRNSYGFAA